ncbi:Transcriptional antiterminator [Pelagirhabdus alkalitolerans]|uniref:Transcriptional antiterminator n=1 Tax=Pelagirhabdus alkalitolerans TaxID=1612202 RepID=A0A1G6JR85_9BACI|nr:BglG family transcription antiterminator [Pelagirhabdus alkalitolerans]SDC21239.1 Transcriptional antiterminator [Pelagirhabdus alkalitolerans]
MSLKHKQKLIDLLVGTDDYLSATEISEHLGVSTRTIHSYLNSLAPIIKCTGLSLEKKTGLGIKLNGDTNKVSELLQTLEKQATLDLEPSDRQQIIFKRLLQGERVSYLDLADQYFVSRSTIVKDMKAIRETYSIGQSSFSFNNEGTKLEVTERMLQEMWGKYFYVSYSKLFGNPPYSLIHYSAFIKDELFLSNEAVNVLIQSVEELGTKYQLAEYYRIQLFENLSLLYYRVSQDYHFEGLSGYIFERVTELDTYYIAHDLASHIQESLDVVFSTQDILFLNQCLVANGLKQDLVLEGHSYFEYLADELIVKIGKIMNEDLSEDEQLKTGLLHHLVPMLFRLRNDITLTNPYIHEIKKQYSMMFHLTWYVVVDMENELGIRMPEDEIGFLMIHFQSALERKRDIKKVLIICQSGLLTTEILERRIKQFLPSVHVYEMISEEKVANVDLSKVDLIISTVDLTISGPPVIELSSIPTDRELSDVVQRMNDIFESNSHSVDRIYDQDEEHPLIHSLKNRLTIKRAHLHSESEALKYLTKPLVDAQLVNPDYLDSVFQREAMSSTAFETGVAIPHGNPSYVNQTHISILVNEKKITWGKEKVDVIILISVAKEDMEHISMIIGRIYDMMQSRSEVERIFINQSDQSIYRYLARHQ